MSDTSQNSHKEKANDHTEAEAAEQTDQKAGSRKGIVLSNFLIFAFGSVGLVFIGLAINYHTKGGHNATKLALLWGIIGYGLFGVGLYFAYFEYVVKPARAAEQARQKAEAVAAQEAAKMAKTDIAETDAPAFILSEISLWDFQPGKKLTYRITVKNIGKLPARQVYIQSKIDLATEPPKEFTFVHSTPGSRIFMPPNAEASQGQTADGELREDQFEYVKLRRGFLFIYVRVTYVDHADRSQVQEFCVYYALDTDSFTYWHEHNEVKQQANSN